MSLVKNYQWILFDADDTLFHFDAYRGLQRMFLSFGVEFNALDYQGYQLINKSLWIDYQNHRITSEELQQQRFHSWANKLRTTPQELNNRYMAAMVEICAPLDGAISLLSALKGKAKLGIITNGFTALQHARLERMGLGDHFDLMVISEQVGVAKPHQGIFDHAFANMGKSVEREYVLMVGDTPESDILGGINAGLHTCWLNADNKPVPEGISPNYQVATLGELEDLLFGRQ